MLGTAQDTTIWTTVGPSLVLSSDSFLHSVFLKPFVVVGGGRGDGFFFFFKSCCQ